MKIEKFVDLYGDDLKRYGFNQNTSKEEFTQMVMHINNMGGVDEDQFNEVIYITENQLLAVKAVLC